MADLDTIPFADDGPTDEEARRAVDAAMARARARGPRLRGAPRTAASPALWMAATSIVSTLHVAAIWLGIGGMEGLTNGWPIWRDDHPIYFHTAMVNRPILSASWTTAGYDPFFMAGYPKSVVFPSSSTLPDLVIWAFGGTRPELAYKVYVLVAVAALPWLVSLAAAAWRLGPRGIAIATTLFLLYLWTDFPINYAAFGMVPYLVSIPLALVAAGLFADYLRDGGPLRWLLAAAGAIAAWLAHLTVPMVLGPAAGLAYLGAISSAEARRRQPVEPDGSTPPRGLPWTRHLGVWMLVPAVLAANAFWWLPALWLGGTKGPSDFAFAHSGEPLGGRLLKIFLVEAEAESILIAAGLVGLTVLLTRSRILGAALAGFALAGFFWGYLAAFTPALDFLQPGRQTYAFYAALAVAAGAGGEAILRRLADSPSRPRLGLPTIVAAVLILVRVLGPELAGSVRARLGGPEPFLSSRPSGRLLWVADRVKAHVKPGERLLYEEGGKDLPGIPDPFRGGRFSGLIPERFGVECLGGPYLHASLTTNFTQFGEGKLFGQEDWDRDFFVEYARIYRPSAILCWSPHARRFCKANPDLVKVVDDDGTLLFGRVEGFGGDAIEGSATVRAEAGRLVVSGLRPGVDGSVVLRYHHVPSLRATPPVPIELRQLGGDPVPFIALRPPRGVQDVVLEMAAPFGIGADGSGPNSKP
ncbi:hypothetical protein OJF2_66210 [Aquisphaera giovannonii]|uniref:Bacterial membrane protein YfhO n=1 Tax=Aquisphaera giovannonii TaxID=406548 RepID=A0A5B9WD83_9BACT|nr:hypothetical protein [Aquisphaera giovannonii]QEH38025.1 hypothetical protein OJF2_66210 [Aquisphaera giovannonii]